MLGLELVVRDVQFLCFGCPDGDSTFSVDLVDSVADADVEQGDRLLRSTTSRRYATRLRDRDGHRVCRFHASDNGLTPPWRV